MRLHLERNRGGALSRDDQRILDRRKRGAVESNVHDRPANGDHPAIDRPRLFHRAMFSSFPSLNLRCSARDAQ
jgi:hypothetical protein